jgi:hypothetical protein
MRDLTTPRTMKSKALLFLFLGFLSATLLLLDRPTLRTATLLTLTIWAFCRCYYFVFYVLEHYIDPARRYSGLFSLARQILRK